MLRSAFTALPCEGGLAAFARVVAHRLALMLAVGFLAVSPLIAITGGLALAHVLAGL